MAFRDDKEAMRARIQALESELETAREAAASRGDEMQMQARVSALEAELRATRAEASEEQKASEARNRDLEQELDDTRQALKRAEWRARGFGSDPDGESASKAAEKHEVNERESDPPGPSAAESPLLNMGAWQGQLFTFVIVVAVLVFLAWKMFAEGARWWE